MTGSKEISGEVADTVDRSEVANYIVPDAVRFHTHDGEEIARIVSRDELHPINRLRDYPLIGPLMAPIVGMVYSIVVPRRYHPPGNPVVIAPEGTFETGEHVTIQAEPVVDPDTPAGDGSTLTYRLVETEGSQ